MEPSFIIMKNERQLQEIENKVARKIFRPKRAEASEDWMLLNNKYRHDS
jgi:hypothetical protein